MTTFRKQWNNLWRYSMSCECEIECICEEEYCECELETCECVTCVADMAIAMYDDACPCGGNCQCGN